MVLLAVIFAPYIMHHKNAGKQIMVSGIAIPSHGIKNIVENIAVRANNEARTPIVFSD